MAHTMAPWSSKYKLINVYSMMDSAELAARLGALSTWDRRGNIVWEDPINASGNKWSLTGNGTGNDQAVSQSYAEKGDNSMKLTTGSDGGMNAQMGRHSQLCVEGNIGLEISFSMDSDIDYITLTLLWRKDSRYTAAKLKVDQTNSKLSYLNSGNTFTELASSLQYSPKLTCFYTLKMVLDVENKNWVRVIHQDVGYSLANISLYDVAIVTHGYMEMYVHAYGTAGNNATIYVDNVILTQNEP